MQLCIGPTIGLFSVTEILGLIIYLSMMVMSQLSLTGNMQDSTPNTGTFANLSVSSPEQKSSIFSARRLLANRTCPSTIQIYGLLEKLITVDSEKSIVYRYLFSVCQESRYVIYFLCAKLLQSFLIRCLRCKRQRNCLLLRLDRIGLPAFSNETFLRYYA